MDFYLRPLVPLTLALAGGIMLGAKVPGVAPAAWILAAAGLLWCMVLALHRRHAAAWPLVLFLAIGYLLVQPWASPRFPEDHVARLAGGEAAVALRGVVADAPVVSGFRRIFILRCEAMFRDGDAHSLRGRLRVSVTGPGPALAVGDRISFSARIRPVRSFRNPGGFDYRRYMAFNGVWATTSVRAAVVRLCTRRAADGTAGWVRRLRQRLSDQLEGVGTPKTAAVLNALLLGDRRQMPPALREAFQRVGIGHLLAISGLHVGLVATAVFFLFRWLLSRCSFFLERAWARKGAAVPALVAVWGYGLLAGMSPSTQRAVIMITVFLLACFWECFQDTVNTVAVAALVILVAAPTALFSISFQLSFAAVVTIVLGLRLLPEDKKAGPVVFRRRMARRVGLFCWVSVCAILGTLPLTLHYFNETSLLGVATNLVFIPLIGFGVVPPGLLFVCMLPVAQGPAQMGLGACSRLLEVSLAGVEALAEFPFASVETVTPSWLEVTLYYGLLFSLGAGYYTWRKSGRPAPGAVVCVAIAALGLAADGIWWVHARFGSDRLRVTVLDVGHGNATLLELPGGMVVLVDGGGFSDNAAFDIGRRVVAPMLWRRKIRTVDTLVLSHPDSDHVNGLVYIAEHFFVRQMLSNQQRAETRGYRQLMATVCKRGIATPAFDGLPRSWRVGSVHFALLHPPGDFLDDAPCGNSDENDNSLVLKVSMGQVSFLLPGDITAAAERALVASAGGRLRSRVLVAPHHGSRSSNSREFLEQVAPDIVVVSAGWRGRSTAPCAAVAGRYAQVGARVLTTPRNGAVSFVTNGRALAVHAMAETGGE